MRIVLIKFFKVCIVFSSIFYLSGPAIAQKSDKGSKKDSTKNSQADSAKKDSKKSYLELLKKAESHPGVFKVHKVEKDFYFEIPLSLVDRDFLLINKISSVPLAINEAGINKGMNTENKVIRFSVNKELGNVWVKTIVPQVESPLSDAITKSVNDNFTGSVIESFKIETYSPDSSAVLVKINKVFDGTEKSFNDVFNDIGLGTSAKTSLSGIEKIKSFPQNIVVRSVLSTSVTEGQASVPVSVTVTTNLLLLPEKPMTPRFADERVGFFSTPRWYFSDKQQQMEKRQLITRWRLEPKAEDRERYNRGELVEPQKPVIFYIDPATPPQWVKYIKDGINDWRKAFEQAGFRNAIQAREVADSLDFDADDARFSVVTYAASPKSNAMGPAVIDPRSGEILESDVIWWHNVMTSLKYWMRIQTGIIDPRAREKELPVDLMGNAIRFVSSHEIGHTLGLKHNMGSSAAYPVDSLRSPSFTGRMGTAPSIMDYARFNYVAQPEDKVTNINPQIGVYDKYAIAWGYRWLGTNDPHDEISTLKQWIVAHQNDPLYHYGEQQDPNNIIDPRAQSEDLGDNSVKASYYGLNNLKRLIPQIADWVLSDGDSYYEAGKLYMAAIQQWHTYSSHVIANIGGFYLENPAKGDGKDAYTSAPAAMQQEALEFIKEQVLNVPEWLFNEELLKKTMPVQDSPMGPFEYTPYNLRRSLQYDLIYQLLSDERILRLVEAEVIAGKEKAFSAAYLLKELRATVFKETLKGRSLNVYQRMLQQNYIDALLISSAKLVEKVASRSLKDNTATAHQNCAYMIPEGLAFLKQDSTVSLRNMQVSMMSRTSELAVLKRGELISIAELLEKKRRQGDETTRMHYEDLLLRIRQSLKIN